MISDIQLIAELVVYMRAERGLAELTIDAYQTDLLQFSDVLTQAKCPRSLFTAEPVDVALFLEHLTDHGILERSRSRKIASLRGLYKWLERKERIERNPMRLTVLPKAGKTIPKPIDQERLTEIFDTVDLRACADDAKPIAIRNLAILEVLYSTACRRNELRGMDQGDLTLRTGRVIVRGKGNKERVVILGTKAKDALDWYIKEARPRLLKKGKGHQKALFLSDLGRRISNRRLGEIVAAAGTEDDHLTPHRFRHSGATHMLEGGADIRKVQELLGHEQLSTTQGYTQVTKAQLQDTHTRSHPRG